MNDIDRQIIEEIRRLKTALAISDRREVSAGLFAPLVHTHAFADLTSKPTTLAGYGITDVLKAGAGVLTLSAAGAYTLTVPGTGTVALGANTLGVSTTNSTSGANHTHGIDYSFSPGVASKILATNAAGQLTLTGKLTAMGGVYLGATPTVDGDAISRSYVSARGMNLMANGSGLLGTNYNLSSLTFDAVETHGGGGSFKATTSFTVLSDEYIAVDTTRYYRGVEWVKNGDADGTRYDAAAGHYGGSAAYDIDKNLIGAQHVMKHAGSTDTTLAVALNPGDTTMVLTNATGWNNGGVGIGDGYTRQVAWWPYLNSLGYAYPAYTYSRNHSGAYAAYSMYSTVGMWAPGGVSGNTVTLAAPWPGPTLPVGTPIRNATSGGTYDYFMASNVKPAQNVWTRYEGTIGPLPDPTGGWTLLSTFRPGTAFIKMLFLMNYSGYTTNTQRVSDIWFSELSAQNLEEATQTKIGVVGIGTQYFSGSKRWYVPTTAGDVVAGYFPTTGSYRTYFVNTGSPTTRIALSMFNSAGTETIRLDPASSTFINTGGYVGIGTSAPGANLHVVVSTTATSSVAEAIRFEARVSTTSVGGGTGFGPAADFYGESATDGNYRQMGRIAATYATATDISRKAKLSFWAGDATALRLGLTIESDGAQALTKVGDGTTNYTQFDGSGHQTMVGTATVFNDEKGNLSSAKITSPSSKVVQDDAESAYYFKNTATTADYLWLNIQFNHDRKLGSVTSPHLHWRQASATIPNWIIQYRWQKQGAAVTTAWTSIKWTSHAFTYTSGTLNQITDFNDITPPAGDGISDQLQVRIIRDTGNASGLFAGADGLAGDAYVTDFDTHKESDSLGSNSEYSK